jgi:hypothetical protein
MLVPRMQVHRVSGMMTSDLFYMLGLAAYVYFALVQLEYIYTDWRSESGEQW